MKKIALITLSSFFALGAFADDKPVTLAEIKSDTSIRHIEKSAPSLENLRDPYKALEVAKEQGKILIYHFTGSAWCPPCMFLEKKVMHTQELADYAKDNVVYVNMDFTRGGASGIDPDFGEDYEELASKYGIVGFPTLIITNPKNNRFIDLVGVNTKNPAELIKVIEDFKQSSAK